MGYLRIKENKCRYIKKERRLKEQLMNGINNDMMTEIIRELTAIKKTNEIPTEKILALARRVEEQRAQKALFEATKKNKCFDAKKKQKQK